MSRFWTVSAFAILLGIVGGTSQASAAPPTVTPSPGYDARLQEQHKAATATPTPTPTPADPVAPSPQVRKRHVKRTSSH